MPILTATITHISLFRKNGTKHKYRLRQTFDGSKTTNVLTPPLPWGGEKLPPPYKTFRNKFFSFHLSKIPSVIKKLRVFGNF